MEDFPLMFDVKNRFRFCGKPDLQLQQACLPRSARESTLTRGRLLKALRSEPPDFTELLHSNLLCAKVSQSQMLSTDE